MSVFPRTWTRSCLGVAPAPKSLHCVLPQLILGALLLKEQWDLAVGGAKDDKQ